MSVSPEEQSSIYTNKGPASISIDADLAPGERLQLTIEADPITGEIKIQRELISPSQELPLKISVPRVTLWTRFAAWLRQLNSYKVSFSPQALLAFGVVIYLISRGVGLDSFPISFTSGEAISSVLASDLLQNNFRGPNQDLLPAFVQSPDQSYYSFTVYLHLLISFLFGKSIFVVRGFSILITLIAILCAVWIMKDILRAAYWWLIIFIAVVIPSWFLLSRTGLSGPMVVTLLSGALYAYMRYLRGDRYALFVAVLLGSLTFYTYPPMLPFLLILGIGWIGFNFSFHIKHWKDLLLALGLLAILMIPLLRFAVTQPLDFRQLFFIPGSYLESDASVVEKLGIFIGNYIHGINPFYWFSSNNQDPILFRMLGYAYLPFLMLPFIAGGIWIVIHRWDQPPYRILLFTWLASPLIGAFTQPQIHFNIFFIFPSLLLCGLGLNAALEILEKYRPLNRIYLAYGSIIILTVIGLVMVSDALKRGPNWFHDYGNNGLQYGAEQVFSAIQEFQVISPGDTLSLSTDWADQVDVLRRFFLPDDANVVLGSPDWAMQQIQNNLSNYAFLLSNTDYQHVLKSERFLPPEVEKTIPYPDGSPGFFLIRLKYRPDIEKILQAEKAALSHPVTEQISLDGQMVNVTHPPLDEPVSNAFDGDPNTLTKTKGANPLYFILEFPEPRNLHGLTAHIGSEAVQITAQLQENGDQKPKVFIQNAAEGQENKDVTVDFGGPQLVKILHFEMKDIDAPDISNVHIWDLILNP